MYFSLIVMELIIYILFNFFVRKRKIGLNTIFAFLWLIITILARLELFNMVHVSEKVYKIVFIGCTGFCTVTFLDSIFLNLYHKRRINQQLKDKYLKKDTSINSNLLKFLLTLTLIFYTIVCIKVVQLLLSGTSYAVIRSMYQGYYGYSSVFPNELMKSIDTYIAHPFLYVIVAIFILSFFEKNIIGKKWQIISGINIVLYLICSASRFLLLYVIVELAFCIYFYYRDLLKKHKKRIIEVLIILCVIIVLMTYFRSRTVSNGNYTIVQNLYAYFTVEFPLMDYWIDKIPENVYGYGMSFFHGIIAIFAKLIEGISGDSFSIFKTVTETVVPIEENFISVFPWKRYNAFVSMFYFFYLDFRYFGVFIGSMFFGKMCSTTDYKFYNTRTLKSKVIFLLMLQNVFTSFVRWQFFNINMVMAFIFVYLLFVKVSIRKSYKCAKEVI